MTKIRKRAIIQKILSIIFSFLFPIGVLLLIFGALKHTPPMWITGIIFTVFCFYATPLSWVGYGELKAKAFIADLILSGTKSICLLCSATGRKPAYVRRVILSLIADGTLFGYNIINEEYIAKNNLEAEEIRAVKTTIECPSCGAKVELTNGKGKCEYCGNVFNEGNPVQILLKRS